MSFYFILFLVYSPLRDFTTRLKEMALVLPDEYNIISVNGQNESERERDRKLMRMKKDG